MNVINRTLINFDDITLVPQPTVQHYTALNGLYGQGYRVEIPDPGKIEAWPLAPQPEGYFEESDKDMVVALPGQVTTIRAKFDKPGRYVW